jgi:hypothetical protein
MRWIGKAVAIAALVTTSSVAMAQSGTATVDATMSTYLAGGNSYTLPPGCAAVGCTTPGGIAPVAITLTAGTGRLLSFSSVTGAMTFCPAGTCAAPTPDGQLVTPTALTASGRISGINAPSSGFLAGVFLAGALPTSAPSSLDFTSLTTNFSSLSPVLGQQFFIGDGRTATNLVQQFLIPDAATTLYLGIADGFAFTGAPGFYDDNVGSYQANYSVTTTVPEPSTLLLLTVGLGALAIGRRRRQAA